MPFCEFCDEDIDKALYEEWDYRTYFDFECPHCGKEMEVEVQSEPIFVLTKKEINV